MLLMGGDRFGCDPAECAALRSGAGMVSVATAVNTWLHRQIPEGMVVGASSQSTDGLLQSFRWWLALAWARRSGRSLLVRQRAAHRKLGCADALNMLAEECEVAQGLCDYPASGRSGSLVRHQHGASSGGSAPRPMR
jgi:NAD(P)H-hydrate repair Nnr-like enzyme with NAD(P)H-hydrate dehydratase domain